MGSAYIMIPLIAAAAASAGAAKQEDVRGISLPLQNNIVLDEKCVSCHNREKIDAAIKERKDMERVVKIMEKKGVVLTDADRQVLAHFWNQNPLKK